MLLTGTSYYPDNVWQQSNDNLHRIKQIMKHLHLAFSNKTIAFIKRLGFRPALFSEDASQQTPESSDEKTLPLKPRHIYGHMPKRKSPDNDTSK